MASRFWEASRGRAFVARLATGSDLIAEIETFCGANRIQAAWVSAIGALRQAAFAYYDQREKRYVELASDEHHELVGFAGNISMRDGSPFLHAHATFCDRKGATVGGHLLRGCTVFLAEVQIREMTGVELVRHPDEETGLAVW